MPCMFFTALVGAHERPERRQKCSHIGKTREPHREKRAVGGERELGSDVVSAAVAVGDEASRSLIGPFDRPPERPRRMQEANVLGKHHRLHAERAADLAGQDADGLGVDPHRIGDVGAHAEYALRTHMESKAIVPV